MKIERNILKIDNEEITIKKCGWTEMNKKVKSLKKKGIKTEYLGEAMDERKKMYCVFREITDDGRYHIVDNDIVFTFQKTGDPINRNKKLNEMEKE